MYKIRILIFSICFSKDYTASKVTIPCSRIILFLTFVYSSSFNKPNAYILPRTASFFANFKASKISSCLSFLLFQTTGHQIRYGQIQYILQCGCFSLVRIFYRQHTEMKRLQFGHFSACGTVTSNFNILLMADSANLAVIAVFVGKKRLFLLRNLTIRTDTYRFVKPIVRSL